MATKKRPRIVLWPLENYDVSFSVCQIFPDLPLILTWSFNQLTSTESHPHDLGDSSATAAGEVTDEALGDRALCV